MLILNLISSLLPVMVFLLMLKFLDSYKLLGLKKIFIALSFGFLSAFLSYLANTLLLTSLNISFADYSKYIAPVIEEILKAGYMIYLIKSKRTGFLIDSAILGFAVGTGFSIIENVYYLFNLEASGNAIWILRGLGTAIMHGGTTAIFAMMYYNLHQFSKLNDVLKLSSSILIAITIHWFFNQFYLSPKFLILLQLILFPVLFVLMFKSSERKLHNWLAVNLDAEMTILEHIHLGKLSETKIGQYIETIKGMFPMETIVDVLCFIRIHYELAIRAKGALLMKKVGLDLKNDQEIYEKFTELEFLRKNIGKTGMLALSPILNEMSLLEWQKEFIKNR